MGYGSGMRKETAASISWRSEPRSAYSKANVRKYKAELPGDVRLSATNAPRWTVRARMGKRSVTASGFETRKAAAEAAIRGLR